MNTQFTFLAIYLTSLLGGFLLLGLSKGALLHLVRPPNEKGGFRACVLPELIATFVAGGIYLVLSLNGSILNLATNVFRCAICTVVIAGSEILAPVVSFTILALLSSLVVLSIRGRRHLLRAWLAASFVNVTMLVVISATVILLISPPPFLVPFQSARERAGRVDTCYPSTPR